MTNRQEMYAAIPQQSDMEFLYNKVKNLEQELSDLTFEFNQTLKELKRN
jgi:hypothetical protein